MTAFIFMGREELISLLLELSEWHELPMMKKDYHTELGSVSR